jgi:hypothetical protein
VEQKFQNTTELLLWSRFREGARNSQSALQLVGSQDFHSRLLVRFVP